MKRILWLGALARVLLLVFSSCSDKRELPLVDVQLTVEGRPKEEGNPKSVINLDPSFPSSIKLRYEYMMVPESTSSEENPEIVNPSNGPTEYNCVASNLISVIDSRCQPRSKFSCCILRTGNRA